MLAVIEDRDRDLISGPAGRDRQDERNGHRRLKDRWT